LKNAVKTKEELLFKILASFSISDTFSDGVTKNISFEN